MIDITTGLLPLTTKVKTVQVGNTNYTVILKNGNVTRIAWTTNSNSRRTLHLNGPMARKVIDHLNSKSNSENKEPDMQALPTHHKTTYTLDEKRRILNFITDYNQKHGKGGQSAAVKEYGMTHLTLAKWQKDAKTYQENKLNGLSLLTGLKRIDNLSNHIAELQLDLRTEIERLLS